MSKEDLGAPANSKGKGAGAPRKVPPAPAAMTPMEMAEAWHGIEAVGAIVVWPPPAAPPRIADPAYVLDVRNLVGNAANHSELRTPIPETIR